MSLNNMNNEYNCPTSDDILYSPITKFITLSANTCVYSGTTEDMIVNYVHPFFINSKKETSREDNNNWSEEINGQFLTIIWMQREWKLEKADVPGTPYQSER